MRMDMECYIRARRLGLKAYHSCLQARKPPYLTALDERVPNVVALTRVSLGLTQIPIERVVGTSAKGRANAFAPNFMPILEPNSEFSLKWTRLYDGIVADGMRQPVTALEYMNEYYIVEGNKRISVMKYLGAVFAEAEVTRIIPKKTKDRENQIYFEFLPFYAESGINDIWFSQVGAFDSLRELTGHKPGEKWADEDRMDLRAAYLYFRTEYKNIYSEKLPITTGDAFLLYLTIFGYENAKRKTSAEIAEDLKRMRSEFERKSDRESVSLIMDRAEKHSPGLLNALFGPSKVKAAFMYHRSPQDSGWNYWHDLGRINCENALGDKLETTSRALESPDMFEECLNSLIEQGNRVIFATSPLMLNASVRPSIDHPEVKILCCSLLASYHNVRSYYLRIYEAKFLIGMLAGAMARDDKIGYIADYPIYGSPASVNAFAMGARMVNPRAKVYLEWSTKKDFDPEHPFGDNDISIISNRDINAPKHSSMEYGLYIRENGSTKNLAIPVLDWSRFYQYIIESVLDDSFDSVKEGPSALDYWWGMSSDAIDIVLSSHLDPYIKRLISSVKTGLQSDQFWPFEGEIRSQDGRLRSGGDTRLTPAEILLMDYLADNVVGSIPSADDVKDSAKPLVLMQGVRGIQPPRAENISWKFNG